MHIPCEKCDATGRMFQSRYGGNDPDVWDAGRCEACEGAGLIEPECESCGCHGKKAVCCDAAGVPMCAECRDNEAEAAYEQLCADYHDGGSTRFLSLVDIQADARRLK